MIQHHDGHARITRESGTYIADGLTPSGRPVRITFPALFPAAPELAGVTVAGTCFATRVSDTHPLYCDFKHPVDGRWRSVLAETAWTGEAAPAVEQKRGPFKRPR